MVDVERNRRSDEKTKREEQQRKQDARIYKKIKREQNIKANVCNEESIKSLKKLQKKLQTSAIIWLCAIVPLLILLSSIIGIISTVIYIGVFILLGIIPSIILVIISATITILSFTTLQKDLKKGVLGNMVSLAVNIIIAIISCISFAPTSLLTAIFFIILNAKYSKTISSKIDVVNQSIDQKTSPTR